MRRTRIIPILLLKNRGLVKTKKFKNPIYIGDPINTMRVFNDKEVDEIVILDIEASKKRQPPDLGLIKEIASECFMPLCYGGGIRNIAHIEAIIKVGVEKVSINSEATVNPSIISEAARVFGRQSIVVSVDYSRSVFGKDRIRSPRGGYIKGSVLEYVQKVEELGAGEILLNSVDRDGTGIGYDCRIIHEVSKSVSIPVIACGGAGCVGDFSKAVDAGASAVGAGRMFVMHGRHNAVLITYPSFEELLETIP